MKIDNESRLRDLLVTFFPALDGDDVARIVGLVDDIVYDERADAFQDGISHEVDRNSCWGEW